MVGEVFAGLSALKTAFDLAKGLKDIDDAARRNAAVIELQEKILVAREAQSALLDRVGELEKEVASFETWNAEKQRYQLKQLARGGAALAYALKPDAQPSEPFHCICASCYQRRIKSILQFERTVLVGSSEQILKCPLCGAETHTEGWPPPNIV
ncbi:MAG TPA: hypothetical protein VN930_08625 [Xanthobacteraceae bacterium]|nr:hypothetical protein [Xanthobacteraceae bacterium]